MSKTPKPSTIKKEASAVGHVALWVILAVVALVLVGPSLASRGANAAIKAGVQTGVNTATGVCAEDGLNHTCALPANGNRTGTPPPTTIPTPPKATPYGPPNGKIKPLPSELPPVTAPPAEPAPILSGPPPGGILGELPGVGPVINELGPALKALNP